jgi:adenine phosphoribosyltransferase
MPSLDHVRGLIRDVPDFPQPGIVFKDITPVLADAQALQAVLDGLEERLRGRGFHRIVAIESRGFIFGAALADRLKVGFSPVRKLGKLPYKTHRIEYALEYGKGILESHIDAVQPGEKVAVVDDLLATGGTAWGAAQLVQKQQGEVGAFLFVVELAFLKGRERLAKSGPVESLIAY